MARRTERRLAGLLLAGLLLLLPGPSCAQSYRPSPLLDQGIAALGEEKYVRARALAEQILATQPDSFEGWYILGTVYWRGDGNLPRAAFALKRARALLEKRWRIPIDRSGPWQVHARILFELISVAKHMDLYEEQLSLMRQRDLLYRPPMTAEYGWPLMKLGRIDEARDKLARALSSGDEEDRTVALNTLGAIEFELDHRERSLELFRSLIDEVKRRGWGMQCVFYYNAAESAIGLMRFEEAERDLLEGTRYFHKRSYTSPWEPLALLYAAEGRLPESFSALRRMHQWSQARDPSLSQQTWNGEQRVSATVLLAAGCEEAALGIMRRILDRPDRRGTTSTHADQSEISLLITYADVLERYQQHLREAATWSTLPQWWANFWEQRAIEADRWAATRRAAALIMDNGRLAWSLRPYAPDTEVTEWMRHAVIDVLGEGVTVVEVERLLADPDPDLKRERPYLLLLKGEAELRRGRSAAAQEALREALDGLPSAEALLRARGVALLGRSLEARGDRAGAMAEYRRALDLDATVLRALDVALPVVFEASGDPAAQRCVSFFARSPRFRAPRGDPDAFRVRVMASGEALVATFESSQGTVFARARVKREKDDEAVARALCADLHRLAFAPRIDLSQADINSLDGSNAAGEASRARIQDLFGAPQK